MSCTYLSSNVREGRELRQELRLLLLPLPAIPPNNRASREYGRLTPELDDEEEEEEEEEEDMPLLIDGFVTP